MHKISADIVFPISSPPVENGILILDHRQVVVDVISPTSLDYSLQDVAYYQGGICPGFVNAHCHLELSYLHHKITPALGMASFIQQVESAKKNSAAEDIQQAIQDTDKCMYEQGIVAVGDISNTQDSFWVKEKSLMHYHTFVEVYGSNPQRANAVFEQALEVYQACSSPFKSLVPHAPYSVSPTLLQKLGSITSNTPLSIHHLESEAERLFFDTGTGPIQQMHQKFGGDSQLFAPFPQSPLDYLVNQLGKQETIQLVHNGYMTATDIALSSSIANHVFWCTCPLSNTYIGNPLAPLDVLVSNAQFVTVGTDSLASNQQLNMIEELKSIHETYPLLPLSLLLEWSCLNGARFLGIADSMGSFEKGKKPSVVNITALEGNHLSRHSSTKLLTFS